MSRWRGGQYIDAPHSRNLRFSLTMKAKLQGLFRATPGPETRLLAGGHYPSAPWSGSRPRNTSRWWGGHYPSALVRFSVTVTAKLQGLFRATPGPETRLAGGVGTTPAPLTLFVGPDTRLAGGVGTTPAPLGPVLVTVTAKLQGLFERRQAQRHASLAGGHYPSALLCLSVTVKAKLQGLFERRQAQRHASLAGGQYIDAPHSRNLRFSLTMKAKLQGLFERRQAQRHASWRVGTTPAPWSGSR
ncbi:hypothetical protein G5714_024688 [Onychostoma macrolepis]|uniref:Uncharacterized protein n=1 Tax=Onychostoma macrolepis TaxID=369639 RepID=A0A7J6BHL5_9TELE|nr:hypothetical protein G5714_024688 [Onychostoma macrolepis]